ncbi:hypothetical protein HYY75_06625 [bacterium]|nr:hypothetical protein [bacterium]
MIGPNEVKLLSSKNMESMWEKILNLETAEKIYKKLMGISESSNSKPPSGPVSPPQPETPPSK